MVIVKKLPDQWDYTGGSYIGKDLVLLPYLFKIYNVEDEELMIDLVFSIINTSSKITNERVKQKQKVNKRG